MNKEIGMLSKLYNKWQRRFNIKKNTSALVVLVIFYPLSKAIRQNTEFTKNETANTLELT